MRVNRWVAKFLEQVQPQDHIAVYTLEAGAEGSARLHDRRVAAFEEAGGLQRAGDSGPGSIWKARRARQGWMAWI